MRFATWGLLSAAAAAQIRDIGYGGDRLWCSVVAAERRSSLVASVRSQYL
jgi:hypothetical protein